LSRIANLIYNPAARGLNGRAEARIRCAAGILRENGFEVECAATAGPGTAGSLAADAIRRGAELILAAGGDGTVNEVAGGMAHSRVPLAVLPAGTANVFACEVGLQKNLAAAAAGIRSLSPHRISLARLTTAGGTARHFLLMAGAGFDAGIVERVDPRLKKLTGRAAYWFAGLTSIASELEEFEVHAESGAYKCTFALISRVASYGGDFTIAAGAHLLDRQFEVVLFEGRRSALYLKYLAGVLTHRLEGMRGVTTFRSSRIQLCAPGGRVKVQADGEPSGFLPAVVEILPDALTVLLPDAYANSLPSASRF
jgi:YegS/Rv2252/BmrU family lipid kinase